MRILLDECVPWPMHRLLTNHSCTNVQAQGWGGIKNGELLRLAETDFELFITSDQNKSPWPEVDALLERLSH